ncbi:NAD(P)-dependent methylenetetrahydromethanopterin dehydrogenase [Piscinibacter sakaiensis]|uniref:NAD(P)-dependent methylenetetrahydromethanopterin dehydrogenase n=1 Tax=Piscinibacter sakaiensis TaxID=1547922 RepID=UPI003727089F
MKKLLYQFDTDPHPAVFDNVVAYDGGADHVTAYGGVTPANVGPLVDGAIFTRAPKDKKSTAIFVGGSDMAAGEALFAAVRAKFFAGFRVGTMLDSNGSNTTAAAAVAWLVHAAPGGSLKGRHAVVLAGTGPVAARRPSRARAWCWPPAPAACRCSTRRPGSRSGTCCCCAMPMPRRRPASPAST